MNRTLTYITTTGGAMPLKLNIFLRCQGYSNQLLAHLKMTRTVFFYQ